MKKNKILTGILLVAFMVVGVGFAAITKNLEVSGSATATVDDKNFVVVFTAVDDSGLATIDSNDAKKATITITSGFTKAGDTKTVKLTVTNKSTEATKLNAVLATPSTTNSNTTYFTVTASWGATTTIAPQATAELSVVITLIKTPDNADAAVDTYKSTFTVSFTATAQAQA